MRNHLIPEARPDKTGRVVVRYVKPFEQSSTTPRFAMPSPVTASSGRVQNQGIFEKLVNSVLEFLLGPADNDTAKESEAREILRERISELPQRTLKYVKDTWQEMESRADEGLDKTQFGQFSEKVRADVKTLLERDANGERPADDIARDIETIIRIAKVQAQKFKARAEARVAQWGDGQPQQPSHAFLSGYQHHTGPYQKYSYQPQEAAEQEQEVIHEGTIHDAPNVQVDFPPMPDRNPQSYYHASGVDTLNDMLGGPKDAVDPMLGGNGG